jgi:hypothetical protein
MSDGPAILRRQAYGGQAKRRPYTPPLGGPRLHSQGAPRLHESDGADRPGPGSSCTGRRMGSAEGQRNVAPISALSLPASPPVSVPASSAELSCSVSWSLVSLTCCSLVDVDRQRWKEGGAGPRFDWRYAVPYDAPLRWLPARVWCDSTATIRWRRIISPIRIDHTGGRCGSMRPRGEGLHQCQEERGVAREGTKRLAGCG